MCADVLVPRCVAQPPPLSWHATSWELASRTGFVHIFMAQLVDTCSTLRARRKFPEPRNNRFGGHAQVTQHASPESRECEGLGSAYARSTPRPSTHPPQPWNPSELSAVIPLATRHLCAAGVILPACSHDMERAIPRSATTTDHVIRLWKRVTTLPTVARCLQVTSDAMPRDNIPVRRRQHRSASPEWKDSASTW